MFTLTPKLNRIFRLAKKGLTNRQIAKVVGTPKRTLDTYLYVIYRRLGVSSRYQMCKVPPFLITVKDERLK